MGRLVEDMTRLVGEIQALRGSRRAFRKELADGERDRQRVALAFRKELAMDVIEMCADFADTHARMAKRTKEERLAGERDRQMVAKAEIAARRAGEKDRQTVAKGENAARHRAWAEEQAGARRAWAGRGA